MCGFAGVIDLKRVLETSRLEDCARAMAARLASRGPDDDGFYMDKDCGVALGFRRLSIVDLSDNGHQPMLSHDGRYVIVFNGEIYNFKEIRQNLEDSGFTNWHGRSDTEVMLAAISFYGIEKAIRLFDGMFAFALWDITKKRLYLVRDRLGEKPLYYGWCGTHFVFASELKAFMAHTEWQPKIENRALTAFLRFSYVPEPLSIYRGIIKLRPGHYTYFDVSTMMPTILPRPKPYWDPTTVFEACQGSNLDIQEDEALSRLEFLLTTSIKRRLLADVPLGVFLSGGIDSSLITALAQKETMGTLKTFTVGFENTVLSEAAHAEKISKEIGTEHTTLIADENSLLKVIERLPSCYDEPFGDISQIPTILLAEMTRSHVTAVLSGDGGDELFGGYPRYDTILERHQRNNFVRRACISLASSILPGDLLNKFKSPTGRPTRLGDKLSRMAEESSAETPEAMQALFMSRWRMADPTIVLNELGYFGDNKLFY